MFKWIARKILSKEICDYEYEIQKLNYKLKTCEEDITTLSNKYSEYDVLKGSTTVLQEENERLKKENDTLREYYRFMIWK